MYYPLKQKHEIKTREARAGQKQHDVFLLVSVGWGDIAKVDNSFGPIEPANPSLRREKAKYVCTIRE